MEYSASRHEAELHKFLVALLDFRQQRAGCHRHDGVLRDAPAGLFHDFIRHALRAFGVVGAHVHVHERPAELARDLGAEAVHFVVMTFDGDHVRAIDERVDDFSLLQIGRDENVSFQAGGGRIGGDGIGEVAGGSASDGLKAEFPRTAQRDAHHAVFEGQGRVVDRVVLDPEFANAEYLGEPIGLDERREADLQADGRIVRHGQQLAVAPHGFRARLNGGLGERLLDAVVIVGDFERAEVEFADVRCFERIFAAALAALERLHESFVFFTHK